ncbi:hypothetical protein AB1K80_15885 [Bacillus sp. 179-C3.3 HS]
MSEISSTMKKEKPKKNTQKLTDRGLRELMATKYAKTEKSQRRGITQKIKGVNGMTKRKDKKPNEQMNQMNLDIPQIDEEKTRAKKEGGDKMWHKNHLSNRNKRKNLFLQ